MSQIVKSADETGFTARADRRYSQGKVIDVDDKITFTATVDVGEVDTRGNPRYLHDVPFQPQTPPIVGDSVTLLYTDVRSQSVVIAGSALGGQNSVSQMPVVGATVA